MPRDRVHCTKAQHIYQPIVEPINHVSTQTILTDFRNRFAVGIWRKFWNNAIIKALTTPRVCCYTICYVRHYVTHAKAKISICPAHFLPCILRMRCMFLQVFAAFILLYFIWVDGFSKLMIIHGLLTGRHTYRVPE